MTNATLIQLIETGKATAGQYRRYADLVTRRKDAAECKYAHFGCALIKGGPCLDESLGNAVSMEVQKRAAAELERRGEVAKANPQPEGVVSDARLAAEKKAITERAELVTEAHLIFLDKLRESGVTNMFGAGPYLVEAFGLSQSESHKVLGFWMKTFSDRHPREAK